MVVAFLLFGSTTAHAYLIDRGSFAYEDGTGNTGVANLIYDVDYDITWVGHGNLAETSGFDDDGLMDWYTADAWAKGLTIGGSTDWLLPTAFNQDGSGPTVGTGGVIADGSEMGHLFYGELSGTVGLPISGSVDSDLGLFPGLKDALYWSGTDTGFSPIVAWYFDFNDGGQIGTHKITERFALAVHQGDVAKPIPEPSTWVLLGIGLISIAVVSIRKKQSSISST
ncbi:MAG: PEP-CTERM sorting domain-containing protein [Gammaproteobacteria bacterium]|nr:PEP-CTERM sorting domain-containing protein [Gammaproteobacteria bacterium]